MENDPNPFWLYSVHSFDIYVREFIVITLEVIYNSYLFCNFNCNDCMQHHMIKSQNWLILLMLIFFVVLDAQLIWRMQWKCLRYVWSSGAVIFPAIAASFVFERSTWKAILEWQFDWERHGKWRRDKNATIQCGRFAIGLWIFCLI